jgi:hypothetical protein
MVKALINGGGHFLFIEAVTFARLRKLIYGGGRLKTTASKMIYFRRRSSTNTFSEAGMLYGLPPKIAAQTAHTSARYHTHHIYRVS